VFIKAPKHFCFLCQQSGFSIGLGCGPFGEDGKRLIHLSFGVTNVSYVRQAVDLVRERRNQIAIPIVVSILRFEPMFSFLVGAESFLQSALFEEQHTQISE
jgi:hypothetical protein